jgi:hypothetical protein
MIRRSISIVEIQCLRTSKRGQSPRVTISFYSFDLHLGLFWSLLSLILNVQGKQTCKSTNYSRLASTVSNKLTVPKDIFSRFNKKHILKHMVEYKFNQYIFEDQI